MFCNWFVSGLNVVGSGLRRLGRVEFGMFGPNLVFFFGNFLWARPNWFLNKIWVVWA